MTPPRFVVVWETMAGVRGSILCQTEQGLARAVAHCRGRGKSEPHVWVYRLDCRADQWLACRELH